MPHDSQEVFSEAILGGLVLPASVGLVPLFYVQVLSLFKLAKVVRIQRVLRELDVSLHCKAQIRLVMIIIFLALVYHWLSCLWSL